MALSQAALCELADVKTALSISGSTEDTLLERLIEVSSSRINKWCNRTFNREDELSEFLAGYGFTDLIVSRPPILGIDFVKINGATIDSSSYESINAHAKQGVIHRDSGWTWTSSYIQNINEDGLIGTERLYWEVQYDGGFVTANQVTLGTFTTRTLPFEIEQACIDLATMHYMRQGADPRKQSETVDKATVSYSVTGQLSQELPAYITGPLSSYRLVAQS